MKKIVLLYAIAAFIACSCTGMQEAPEISGVPMVLTAYQEGTPDTKTAVEDGGKLVFWEPGDEIKVFSGSRSGRFTSNATGLTEVTEFTGRLEGDEPDVADIWAVYPYSDDASFDGECITTVIPSVQVARPGTFAQGANVAIAHSTTTSLQFYNVGGGIRFSLTEEGVKKVIFEGLGGEVISGTVKVGFEDGLPKVKEVSGGSIFITLTPPDGGSFTVGEWYYLTAIPGALNSGFKLRFYKDDDTYAKVVSEKAYTIKRKVFGSIEHADSITPYESLTKSYPETEDEWEESFNITQSIVDAKVRIFGNEDFNETDINSVIEAMEKVEGVAEVVPNENATAISIRQSDGAYVTFDLFNPLLPSEMASHSHESHSLLTASQIGTAKLKRSFNNKRNVSRLFDKTGKALLLSPFQWSFNYDDIDEWFSLLSGIFRDVDTLLNSNAGIDKFKGDFLSQYSLVIILTHGHSGLVDAESGFTTELCSGTVYHDGLVKDLLDLQLIDSDTHVSRFVPEGSNKTYLSALPSILGEVSFNKRTAFILMGCETAQKTGIINPTRKMVDALIDREASFVVGNDRSMWHSAMNQYVNTFLGTFANGFSLRQAHIYASKSKLAENWCNYVMSEGQSPKQNWNIYEHTLCFPEESSDEYFGVNPFPSLKVPKSSGNIVLEWESSLPSSFQIRYLYWEPYVYSIVYDVVIDGKNEGMRTSEKQYEITNLPLGEHTAKVITRLLSEGVEILSYPSNSVDFTVINNSSQHDYSVPEAIDLGLSVKWASFNLGASKPEEYGDYFAWGETEPYYEPGYAQSDSPVWKAGKSEGYNWSSYKWCNGSENTLAKYNYVDSYGTVDNKTVLDTENDAAHENWGGSWRMPTDKECEELMSECSWTWTSENGVEGEKVTGPNGNSIFLPAAGFRLDTSLYNAGFWGGSWSSSLDTDRLPQYAYLVFFHSGYVGSGGSDRYFGLSVRPVSE